MHNEYEKQKGQININHISWGTYSFDASKIELNACCCWICFHHISLTHEKKRREKNGCFILILFLMHIWRVLTSIIIERCRAEATQSYEFAVNQGCRVPPIHFPDHIWTSNGDCSFLEKAYWKISGGNCASRAERTNTLPLLCHIRCNVRMIHIQWLLEFSVFDSIASFEHLSSSPAVNRFIFIIKTEKKNPSLVSMRIQSSQTTYFHLKMRNCSL